MNHLSFEKWKDQFNDPDLTLWDYIAYSAHPELAAAFCSLFWPDFVEIEDCVFLAENFKKHSFDEWRTKLEGDRVKLESLINHVHVYDLFPNSSSGLVDLTAYEQVGRTLLKCWSCALSERFPDKQFKFVFSTEPDEYGPTLTFYQESRS